ncbi:MAG: hypothetical protein LBF00_01460 [Mycoplasmataceae bacterium]|jgi:hypothetical protein|nr:hypothetical protein [Mycoplasmataceae bacterium]
MFNINRINYDESLVITLVANVLAKTPGVNVNGDFNVTLNDSHTVLDVVFTPLPHIFNVFQIARKVQDSIYFVIKRNFDLYNIIVNVTIGREEQ